VENWEELGKAEGKPLPGEWEYLDFISFPYFYLVITSVLGFFLKLLLEVFMVLSRVGGASQKPAPH
jgi:hypothetical protein